MPKKNWLIIFAFFFSASVVVSQNKVLVDSLESLISVSRLDTNKVILLNKTAEAYETSDPKKAMKFANSALILAQTLNYKKGVALSFHRIGVIYYDMGEYSNSLFYYYKSVEINEAIGNKEGLANNYSNMGALYRIQNNYDKALPYLYKALKLDEESGNSKALAGSHINIGNIYFDAGNYKKAISYYEKAKKVFERLADKKNIATALNNIGAVYFQEGNFQKAILNFTRTIEICAEIDEKEGIAMAWNNIGQIYFEEGNYTKATEFFKKSLSIALTCGAKDIQKYNYEGLAETAAKTGDFKSAYSYQNKFTLLKDSLALLETNNHINEMAIKYEAEKKEKENVVLKSESTKQQFLNEKQRQMLIYLIAGLMIITVAGLIFFLTARSRRFANIRLEKTVAERTADLNVKNREKEIMLMEIHHRVKNNLQLISSILRLQLHYKGSKNVDEILKVCNDRIKCMAILHDKLYQSKNFSEINTRDYFSELINYVSTNYNDSNGRTNINLNVVPLSLHINQLIPCGLILNELVSNAYKYAFITGNSNKSIDISFSQTEQGAYELKIKDNGRGFPEKFDHLNEGGLGLSIVTSLVEQLDGTIRFENNEGTIVGISFPPQKVQPVFS